MNSNNREGDKTMMLLTKSNRNALPALYATDGDKNAKAVVKFFTPDGSHTWFASEFDGDDTFFGLVDSGHCKELGYFSLKELTAARGRMGLPVERDRWFSATPLSELGSKVHAS
tara:strand:- start:97 stop:438 length:342 start_codon:yes stop_codon:yes gene_type:complete